MILALALFLAVLFGAVGLVTGHHLAKRQADKEIAWARSTLIRAQALARTITQSPAASLDPEAVQQANQFLTNPRKDQAN